MRNGVKDGVLYGAQTRLTLRTFPARGRCLADVDGFVANYAIVKASAARANVECGVLDGACADAIMAACEEIREDRHSAQFPSAVVVGGGGTATNMNLNEVIAARASQLGGGIVHPNDHVNASQSTNDTYPTAVALTVLDLVDQAATALEHLAETFEAKAAEYEGTPHLGRTCLRDAVTIDVGRTHRAHAAALRRTTGVLMEAAAALAEVPLGATAVGTGIGAPAGYRPRVLRALAELTGRELTGAANLPDALAHLDPYARLAAAAATTALTMGKIAADLRLLSSGPVGGFGDLTLPTVQAGSSIMPAKVNPAVPEYVMQLSFRVRGAAHTVELAVAAGELELNVMEPIILAAATDIFGDLTAAAETFADHCVAGLTWDGPRLHHNLAGALDDRIAHALESGYDTATASVRTQEQP